MMLKGYAMGFEFDNNLPIYVQLVEQIKMNIISGKLKCGERLPSVREFALANKVNPNTMQKALGELEELGLIFTERTNGKFVTTDEGLIEKFKKDFAEGLAKKYLSAMEAIGIDKSDAVDYIEKTGGTL